MKLLIIICIWGMLFIPAFIPKSYSFENSTFEITSDTIQNVGIIEKTVKNEVQIENNEKQIEIIRSTFENEISKIQEQNRQEFFVTIGITVVSVFVSGYLGWHIHRREYNAELSKTHFKDIKENTIQPLRDFATGLESNNHRSGDESFFPNVSEIIHARTLELGYLMTVREKGDYDYAGDFDSQLFQDVIENHYPSLKSRIDTGYQKAEHYNEKRQTILDEIIKKLEGLNDGYLMIHSSQKISINKREIDGYPKNTCIVDQLALAIFKLSFNKVPFEEIEIKRHNHSIVAVDGHNIGGIRTIVPQKGKKLKDEKFVWKCILEFYNNKRFDNRMKEIQDNFRDVRNAIDELKLELDRINNRTVLAIKKKKILFHACPYIKE